MFKDGDEAKPRIGRRLFQGFQRNEIIDFQRRVHWARPSVFCLYPFHHLLKTNNLISISEYYSPNISLSGAIVRSFVLIGLSFNATNKLSVRLITWPVDFEIIVKNANLSSYANGPAETDCSNFCVEFGWCFRWESLAISKKAGHKQSTTPKRLFASSKEVWVKLIAIKHG